MSTIQKVIPSAKLSKQHSILFSVIPSRDAKTGKKIVTSDDEDDDEATTLSSSAAAAAATSAKTTDKRPMCQFGAKCYRTNADHLKQFQHPTATTPTKTAEKTTTTTTATTTKPPCAFGAKCYRASSVHLAAYSHPPKSDSKDASEEEILDTRELIEAEEPVSPTTIDNLLIKDKNKGLTFDDDDDDDDSNDKKNEEMITRPKKDWINLENKLKEQSKRLAHLEEIFKTTKRSNSTIDDDQTKRLKTD